MNNHILSFKRTAISAALLAALCSVQAEETDAEMNQFIKPDSTVSIGVGNWSGDRPQLGIYDGMRDGSIYGLFDANIISRDDLTGTWIKLDARNLGVDNREFRGDYIRQGNFSAFLEYNRIPRDNPFTFTTGTQGIGTTDITVGTSLGSFTQREVELGTLREITRLGGSINLRPGLDLKIDFKNEDKTGTRQWGWGSAALFSVEPLDSTTRQLEMILQYSGEQLQISGGYFGSMYDNHNLQVLEQLNGVTGGTSAQFNATTPLSLPLSNQAHQLFIDSGYSFTPTTRGTFKVSYTRATQDEHLPSYDLAGANAPFVNAPSHLDGQIDTTLVQLGLNSRPLPKLSVTANLRYNDINDKTPLAGYVGNNGTGVVSVWNTPHSIKTTSGKLEANYRLPENFSIIGGVDYASQDRTYPTVGNVYVPFRSDLKETTYRLQLRRAFAETMSGSLAYLHSGRDGSTYTDASGTPYANEINPIHIADRNRDKWRAALDWEPIEKLSMQFRVEHSKDTYPDNGRPYGLKEGTAQLYGVDSSYAFSEDWKLSAWYTYDVTKAEQIGFRAASSGAADAVKSAHLKDVGDSLGINLHGKLSAKIEGGAGIDWYNTTSSYPQDLTILGAGTPYPTGTTGPLPDIRNNLLRIKFDAKYAFDKNTDLRVDLIHERWHTDDWSWNFSDGTPFTYYSGNITCTGCSLTPVPVVDGTTVTAKQTQKSNFIGLRYIYKFQ